MSYFELRPLVRFIIAMVILLSALGLMLAGVGVPLLWGLGIVLLMFSFPTRGEKSEWGDW